MEVLSRYGLHVPPVHSSSFFGGVDVAVLPRAGGSAVSPCVCVALPKVTGKAEARWAGFECCRLGGTSSILFAHQSDASSHDS